MSWELKWHIGAWVALAALLAVLTFNGTLFAGLAGFAAGVILCAVYPQIDGGVRAGFAWTFGVYRKVTATDRNIAKTPIRAQESYAKAPEFVVETPNPRARLQINWGQALGNVGRFLWTFKWAILVILFFFFGMGLLRGCVRLPLGESREHAQMRAELAQAEAETQAAINARDAIIAQAAQEAAVHRAQISMLLEQGHREIEAATPSDETPIDPALERAFLGSLERLYANAGVDPHQPDPGGPGA